MQQQQDHQFMLRVLVGLAIIVALMFTFTRVSQADSWGDFADATNEFDADIAQLNEEMQNQPREYQIQLVSDTMMQYGNLLGTSNSLEAEFCFREAKFHFETAIITQMMATGYFLAWLSLLDGVEPTPEAIEVVYDRADEQYARYIETYNDSVERCV